MNGRQFKYVLTLAREGSFSTQAAALNISQPSLSQYIKKIEKEIGLELFDRTNGEVRITDAGRVYIGIGRQILDLEHQMETQLSDLAVQKTGSVIIGTAPYRAAGMLPLIAKRFQEIHPGMHLVVREGTTAELIEGMKHGEYDLALTLLPTDRRDLVCELIVEEELVLAVPGWYEPLAATRRGDRRYPAVDAGVLAGQKLIMLTETQYMQIQLQDLLDRRKIEVKTAAVVKSLEAQIAMVRAGVGMALLPAGIERSCSPGEVAIYSFADPLPKRQVVVMWRSDRKLSGATEDLKNVIHGIAW